MSKPVNEFQEPLCRACRRFLRRGTRGPRPRFCSQECRTWWCAHHGHLGKAVREKRRHVVGNRRAMSQRDPAATQFLLFLVAVGATVLGVDLARCGLTRADLPRIRRRSGQGGKAGSAGEAGCPARERGGIGAGGKEGARWHVQILLVSPERRRSDLSDWSGSVTRRKNLLEDFAHQEKPPNIFFLMIRESDAEAALELYHELRDSILELHGDLDEHGKILNFGCGTAKIVREKVNQEAHAGSLAVAAG